MPTKEEILSKIREKYPVYKDIPDSQLLIGLRNKYPNAYKDTIDKALGFVGEQAPSTKGALVGDFLKAQGTRLLETGRKVFTKGTSPEAQNIYGSALATATQPILDQPSVYPIRLNVDPTPLETEGLKPVQAAFETVTAPARAMASGASPIEGFKRPLSQPSFQDSIIKNLKNAGVTNEKYIQAVSTLGGVVADIGTTAIVAGGGVSGVRGAYKGAQTKAMTELYSIISRIMKRAGATEAEALSGSVKALTDKWVASSGLQRTPWRIKATTDLLKKNEDILVISLEDALPRPNVAGQRPTNQRPYAEKLLPKPLRSASEASAERLARIKRRGELAKIKQRAENYRERYDIALGGGGRSMTIGVDETGGVHIISGDQEIANFSLLSEEELVAAKEGVKKGPAVKKGSTTSSDNKELTTPKGLKELATEALKRGVLDNKRWFTDKGSIPGEPLAYLDIQDVDNPDTALAALIDNDDGTFSVRRQDGALLENLFATKPKEKFVFSSQHEAQIIAEVAIQREPPKQELVDEIDHEIAKRANPELGEEGFAATGIIPGIIDKAQELGQPENYQKLSYLAKLIGQPAMVAQKYPETFGPIYRAVADHATGSNATFVVILGNFDKAFLYNLPEASQAKLSQVFKLENSSDVRVPQDTLINTYKLSPEELKAYKMIRDAYDRELLVEEQTRKTMFDYDKLSPEDKVAFDKKLVDYKNARKAYVNTQRFDKPWIAIKKNALRDVIFSNTYDTKAEALRVTKADLVFHKNDFKNQQVEGFSLDSLNRLLDEVEVDPSTRANLRKAYIGKGLSGKWAHKEDIEGYDFSFKNIVDSALRSAQYTAIRNGRVLGHKAANQALYSAKNMSSVMRAYAENYIDSFYNNNANGYRGLMQLMYSGTLALNPRYLALDLISPIFTTAPALGKYYPNLLELGKVFNRSYKDATTYILNEQTGKPQTLPKELLDILSKFAKERLFGDDYATFLLGAKTLSMSKLDYGMTILARAGEHIKRIHSAIAGYYTGKEKVLLDNPEMLETFMRNFLDQTQPALGRHNIPGVISSIPQTNPWLETLGKSSRTFYAFRGYAQFYTQQFFARMRGNSTEKALSIATILAGAGIFGGLKSLVDWGWESVKGRTAEADVRKKLTEWGLPQLAQDVALYGAPAVIGMDLSSSLGLDPVVNPKRDLAMNIAGAPGRFFSNIYKSLTLVKQGRYEKALQFTPMSQLNQLIKAGVMLEKGLLTFDDKKLMGPDPYSAVLTALGLFPLAVSKRYAEERAVGAIENTRRLRTAKYNKEAAHALYVENNLRKYRAIRNKARKEKIDLNRESLRKYRDDYKGRTPKPQRALRRDIKQTRKLFQ